MFNPNLLLIYLTYNINKIKGLIIENYNIEEIKEKLKKKLMSGVSDFNHFEIIGEIKLGKPISNWDHTYGTIKEGKEEVSLQVPNILIPLPRGKLTFVVKSIEISKDLKPSLKIKEIKKKEVKMQNQTNNITNHNSNNNNNNLGTIIGEGNNGNVSTGSGKVENETNNIKNSKDINKISFFSRVYGISKNILFISFFVGIAGIILLKTYDDGKYFSEVQPTLKESLIFLEKSIS